MPPLQTGELFIIAIRRDPLAAGFDSERSEPSILYEVATRFYVCAQTLEDRPMPWSGRHDRRVRLLEQYAAEVEGVSPRARTRKDPRVSADSHETREHLRRDSIRRWSIDYRFQPAPVSRVIV